MEAIATTPGGRRRVRAGCTTRGPSIQSSGGPAAAGISSEIFSRRSRSRSTGRSKSTVWRLRPTARGSRAGRARTSSCRPRPTGRSSVMPSPGISPRGPRRRATSTWNASPRAARWTPASREISATWSAMSGSGHGPPSCPSRASRCILSTTTSRCPRSTAATTSSRGARGSRPATRRSPVPATRSGGTSSSTPVFARSSRSRATRP